MIEIGRRPFAGKHICRMIGAERSHILPLGVAHFEPMADLKPASFAYALVRTAKRFDEPWHQLSCFSLYPAALHIAVRQRHVERVLERPELSRLETVSPHRIIHAPISPLPIRVPRATRVSRAAAYLTDPKDCGNNSNLPRVT